MFLLAKCHLPQSSTQTLEQTDVQLYVDHTFAFAIPACVPHKMSDQSVEDQDVVMAFDQVITEQGIDQW